MFEELQKVILTHDFVSYNLKKGDRGTIVGAGSENGCFQEIFG
jgi:hypothetical protein